GDVPAIARTWHACLARLRRAPANATGRSTSTSLPPMSQDTVAGPATAAHPLFDKHRELLERALTAIRERTYWSAYLEVARAYGDEAPGQGKAAFDAVLGKRFPLEQAATDGWVGAERSPFGIDLGVTYPHADLDALLDEMAAHVPIWRDAGPDTRAGVCLEIL